MKLFKLVTNFIQTQTEVPKWLKVVLINTKGTLLQKKVNSKRIVSSSIETKLNFS